MIRVYTDREIKRRRIVHAVAFVLAYALMLAATIYDVWKGKL